MLRDNYMLRDNMLRDNNKQFHMLAKRLAAKSRGITPKRIQVAEPISAARSQR